MGCDLLENADVIGVRISTHTSRVGCDTLSLNTPLIRSDFYSHIPCGMWRSQWKYNQRTDEFLLTHPVWDVTIHTVAFVGYDKNFYSHIPCGMWQNYQITALNSWKFLLTHPVWDVTHWFCLGTFAVGISTHTSRVGCDNRIWRKRNHIGYFYSHIPCGMWLSIQYKIRTLMLFLLTHPVWDVTSTLLIN